MAISQRPLPRIGQDEFLNPLAVFDFAGIQVAFRIHRDRINPVELAGVSAIAAERARQRAFLAVENPDHIIGAVGGEQILLLRVVREGEVVDGSARRVLHAPDAAAVGTAGLRRGMDEETG